MELAAASDVGFDRPMFADALARVRRYTDRQFAAYGLDDREAEAIRRRFADWKSRLEKPESSADGQ
jgi:hypothetical protein